VTGYIPRRCTRERVHRERVYPRTCSSRVHPRTTSYYVILLYYFNYVVLTTVAMNAWLPQASYPCG